MDSISNGLFWTGSTGFSGFSFFIFVFRKKPKIYNPLSAENEYIFFQILRIDAELSSAGYKK
jgi:hypothetical protein